MDQSEIERRVLRLVEAGLELTPGAATLDSRLAEDLGSDSLGLIELLLSVEESFELDIPDDEASEFKTPRHVVDYLVKLQLETELQQRLRRAARESGRP